MTAVTRPFCDSIDRVRGHAPQAVLIPNGTFASFFTAADADGRARRALGVPDDKFLLTFAGTLGIAQALPSAIAAAELLAPDNVHLAFIGEGPIKGLLEENVAQRGLSNVSFHDQVALDEIPPYLAASDALLVTLSGHPTFEDFVPSKLIDFMATGRPVVLSAAGEAAALVEHSGGGIVAPPENAEALANAVRRLLSKPDQVRELGRCGQEFARLRMRDAQAERLEQVLLHAAKRREYQATADAGAMVEAPARRWAA